MIVIESSPHLIKRNYEGNALSAKESRDFNFHSQNSDLNNIYNIQKPLKRYPKDISFNGFSVLYKQQKVENYKTIVDFVNKESNDLADKILNKVKLNTKNRIEISGNVLKINQKNFFAKLIDAVIYPVWTLPREFTSWALNGLIKLSKASDKSILSKIYNSKILKSERLERQTEYEISSASGLFSKADKILKDNKLNQAQKEEKLFKVIHSMLAKGKGNYDMGKERWTNRIFSGLPAAVFLAVDFFNLSSYFVDDKKTAKEAQDKRMNQELKRLTINAYLQMVVFSCANKIVNASKLMTLGIGSAMVLVSETLSRIWEGNPVLPIGKEEVKNFNNGHKYSYLKSPFKNVAFNGVKEDVQKEEKSEKKEKSLISISGILKVEGGLLAGGLALRLLRRRFDGLDIFMKNFSKGYKNWYNKYTKEAFKISKEDLNQYINKMEKAGYTKFANKYREAAQTLEKEGKLKDGFYDFGKRDKKIKPIIDFVLYPMEFVKGCFKWPFKIAKSAFGFDKNVSLLTSKFEKVVSQSKTLNPKDFESKIKNLNEDIKDIFDSCKKEEDAKKLLEEISSKLQTLTDNIKDPVVKDRVRNSFQNIQKICDNKHANDFKSMLQNSYLAFAEGKKEINTMQLNERIEKLATNSFDEDHFSKQSNADIAPLFKVFSSVPTSLFLIFDNYNQVMIKSNGQDEDSAQQSAKERAVQRLSSLFCNTMIIQLFNSAFKDFYNSSIMNAAIVTTVAVTGGELFTRLSIGMPITTKSQKELLEIEKETSQATGFKAKYFKFLGQLSGKEPLENRLKEYQSQRISGDKQIAFARNKKIVEQFSI